MKMLNGLWSFAVAVVCILNFAGGAQAASKDEETRFLSEVNQTIQKKDAAALSKLVCWDQADDKAKKMVEGRLQDIIKRAPKKVSLEDWNDFPFKTNIKVTKRLRFAFSESESGAVPVGEKAGKLMIAAPMENK